MSNLKNFKLSKSQMNSISGGMLCKVKYTDGSWNYKVVNSTLSAEGNSLYLGYIMRSLLIMCIASICLSITAGNNQQKNFEIVLQTAPSLYNNPQKVYLYTLIESEHYLLDSALIDNNHKTVRLSGFIPYQKNVILAFSRTNLDAEVAVTPGEKIQLSLSEADAEYFHCIKDAKGAKAQSEYVQFMKYITKHNNRKRHLQDTQSITKIDSISRATISDSLRALDQHYTDFMLKTHKSKYPFMVWYAQILLRKLLPQNEVRNLLNNAIRRFPTYPAFNQLRPGYVAPQESARGIAVRDKMWHLDSQRMKIEPETPTTVVIPQIGEELPILLHREDGRMTSLLVFGGKYVLVDFWASWCQPCLKEIPYIVNAKRKFGDRFEVCAITLDKISSPWKRAINERKFGEGIHHYQGIDRRGNQYKDIAALGFETIPQNYLLDGEGRIIAINIYGEDLIKKLEELIEKHCY